VACGPSTYSGFIFGILWEGQTVNLASPNCKTTGRLQSSTRARPAKGANVKAGRRRAAAEWACIVSPILVLIFGILPFLGVQPSQTSTTSTPNGSPHNTWYFIASLVTAIFCSVLFFIARRSGETQRELPVEENRQQERKLFVCANGYPLTRTQFGLALNLQILSSTPTKLVYAHAMLTRREGYNGQTHQIELESSEPHIIPAMQMFFRMLEVKLDPQEAKRFMAPNVEIMGQLKLEEHDAHDVVQFQFVTHRECPEDLLPQQSPTVKQRTIQVANDLFQLLRKLGPEPAHALSDKSGTVAGQENTFNAYFEWHRKAYYEYMAHHKSAVIQIDSELAALNVFTKLDAEEIDPPKNQVRVNLKKIAEGLILTASYMPD
jgi:hypothetical protein